MIDAGRVIATGSPDELKSRLKGVRTTQRPPTLDDVFLHLTSQTSQTSTS